MRKNPLRHERKEAWVVCSSVTFLSRAIACFAFNWLVFQFTSNVIAKKSISLEVTDILDFSALAFPQTVAAHVDGHMSPACCVTEGPVLRTAKNCTMDPFGCPFVLVLPCVLSTQPPFPSSNSLRASVQTTLARRSVTCELQRNARQHAFNHITRRRGRPSATSRIMWCFCCDAKVLFKQCH